LSQSYNLKNLKERKRNMIHDYHTIIYIKI